MADLETGLTTELAAITVLTNKVFPVLAAQNVAAPYLIYSMDGSNREMILAGHEGMVNARYDLEIHHTTYALLKALIGLVITEVKTWQSTNLGVTGPYVQALEITDESETYQYDTNFFVGVISFDITYSE